MGKKKVKPYNVLPHEPMIVERPFVMFGTLNIDKSKRYRQAARTTVDKTVKICALSTIQNIIF